MCNCIGFATNVRKKRERERGYVCVRVEVRERYCKFELSRRVSSSSRMRTHIAKLRSITNNEQRSWEDKDNFTKCKN